MRRHLSLPARVKVCSLLFIIIGLWLAASAEVQARTWTRQNGDQFEAEPVRQEGGNGGSVVLRKFNGAEVTIRLWNLCEEDQQYVKRCPPAAKSAAKTEPQAAQGTAAAAAQPAQTVAKDANSTSAPQQTRNGRWGRRWWPVTITGRVFVWRPVERR
jgi:hypothetical protein